MITDVHKFRLHESERMELLAFCERHNISQSDALRVLIYDGPVAISFGTPVTPTYMLLTNKQYAIGNSNKLALEFSRQGTNLEQCHEALDRFCKRNYINEKQWSELAPEVLYELPEEIKRRRKRLSKYLSAFDSFVSELSSDSKLIARNASSKIETTSRSCMIGSRIEDGYLRLLSLKSETFQLSNSAYIRTMISFLDLIWKFRISNLKAGNHGGKVPISYVSVLDFADLFFDLNMCGKVLNEVTHYANSGLKDFRTRIYDLQVQRMQALVGKLDTTIDCYESLLMKYALPIPELG